VGRSTARRPTRFRAETDQASRWLAAALLDAEKGFRRLMGYRDLPRLAEALTKHKANRVASGKGLPEHRKGPPPAAPQEGAAPTLRAAPSTPSPPLPAKT
jgi:putative transposase